LAPGSASTARRRASFEAVRIQEKQSLIIGPISRRPRGHLERSDPGPKNACIVAGLAQFGASISIARAPPAPAPSDAYEHYEQKARECRTLAKEPGLSGEALRAFIADCAKPDRPDRDPGVSRMR
jgi:hypothetical protein